MYLDHHYHSILKEKDQSKDIVFNFNIQQPTTTTTTIYRRIGDNRSVIRLVNPLSCFLLFIKKTFFSYYHHFFSEMN